MEPWAKYVHVTDMLRSFDESLQYSNAPFQEWYTKQQRMSAQTKGENLTTDIAKLNAARKGTIRAVSMGLALAAIDGPLPIMDVIAFGLTSIVTAAIWVDFFVN